MGMFTLLFLILFLAYIAYHWFAYVDRSKLLYGQTELNDFLVSRSNILKELYRPPFWISLWTPHMQGTLGLFMRRKLKIPYRSEILRVDDGAELLLNWHDDPTFPEDSPIVLLLPGITGGRDKPYITHMVNECHQRRWRCVVLIFPGCLIDGDETHPIKTPRFYSPSDPSDIKQTVNHIFTRYPNAPIFGLGHSMGACMLVKYLEAVGNDTPMVSCTSLSNPWEWQIVSKNMESGSFLNRKIINPHFAKFWQTTYRKNIQIFKKNGKVQHEELSVTRKFTCLELDTLITRHLYGYERVEDYYKDCSCLIKDVKIPLFVIHALDDPIVPPNALPLQELEKNPNCLTALTKRGGHTGWLEGLLPTGLCFADRLCLEHIESMLEWKSLQGENAAGTKSYKSQSRNHKRHKSVSRVE